MSLDMLYQIFTPSDFQEALNTVKLHHTIIYRHCRSRFESKKRKNGKKR